MGARIKKFEEDYEREIENTINFLKNVGAELSEEDFRKVAIKSLENRLRVFGEFLFFGERQDVSCSEERTELIQSSGSTLESFDSWFNGANRICPDGVYIQSRPLGQATGIYFYQGKSK